jgi:hypothetical protein
MSSSVYIWLLLNGAGVLLAGRRRKGVGLLLLVVIHSRLTGKPRIRRTAAPTKELTRIQPRRRVSPLPGETGSECSQYERECRSIVRKGSADRPNARTSGSMVGGVLAKTRAAAEPMKPKNGADAGHCSVKEDIFRRRQKTRANPTTKTKKEWAFTFDATKRDACAHASALAVAGTPAGELTGGPSGLAERRAMAAGAMATRSEARSLACQLDINLRWL